MMMYIYIPLNNLTHTCLSLIFLCEKKSGCQGPYFPPSYKLNGHSLSVSFWIVYHQPIVPSPCGSWCLFHCHLAWRLIYFVNDFMQCTTGINRGEKMVLELPSPYLKNFFLPFSSCLLDKRIQGTQLGLTFWQHFKNTSL